MQNKIKSQESRIAEGFSELWALLFTTPVHLDSALSKQSPRLKSILAQIVPSILLRPVSLAESLGVGLSPGEPWNLEPEKLVRWRPAVMMAERLHEMMTHRLPDATPQLEDFPPWMTDEWKQNWDEKTVEALVRALGTEPPLFLRASQNVGADALVRALGSEGLPTRIERSTLAPWGVRLAGYAPVFHTRPYLEGAFEIQDEGSQLMSLFALWPDVYADLLTKAPGQKQPKKTPSAVPKIVPKIVIDACAGAGGKSLAMADAMKKGGRVFAYDTSEKKLQALRRRATRLGLNNIQAVAVPEGKETEWVKQFGNKADVVLVDAPCTGWGVLRRNPDIKWRQKRDVLVRMPEIQLRLLSAYSALVKPGGKLIYGVCTFRLSETQDVVKKFLENEKGFQTQQGGFLGPSSCDGFFMQAFTKGE